MVSGWAASRVFPLHEFQQMGRGMRGGDSAGSTAGLGRQGRGRLVFSRGLLLALGLSGLGTAARAADGVLTKSMNASEQRIPLVMAGVEGGGMKVEWVKLRWDNMVSSTERKDALEVHFNQPREDLLFESFRSQMWVSALASGIAWQQPWLGRAGGWKPPGPG